MDWLYYDNTTGEEMKQLEQSLTEGSLGKKIFLFSLPLMLSNLLQVLFNMADIAVVGKFAGSNALGSVGSTSILVTLFTSFLIGVGGGINVLVALHIGAGNKKEAKETITTAYVLCLCMGILLLIVGISSARGILSLMNTKPELIDGAVLYLRIYFLGLPAVGVYNCGNAVLSAAGDTKKPLYFLSIAGAINIALNLLLVIVFHLDVAGVAIASIISQYISAILITYAITHGDNVYTISLRHQTLHALVLKDKLIAILKLGLPSGLQNMVFMFANLFVQVGVNSFSATMVAANSAAANADGPVYEVMAAFYVACSSFMGQNLGAKKKDRVLKSYFVSLSYSFFIGLILGLTILFMGPDFLLLFTSDPAVIELGMYRLKIMSVSYAFSAFMDCTIAASRGLGKTVVPTFIVIMGSCVFRVIWIYTIFAYFKTIPSLYLLYIFSWTITAAAEIIYFQAIYRKEMRGV